MSDIDKAKWKSGYRSAGLLSAVEAATELETIREKHGGELEPEAVVNAARPKKHKLHNFFVWDDRIAADKFRTDQVRNLMRSVVVERPELGGQPIRMYELMTSRVTPKKKAYVTTEDIMADPLFLPRGED